MRGVARRGRRLLRERRRGIESVDQAPPDLFSIASGLHFTAQVTRLVTDPAYAAEMLRVSNLVCEVFGVVGRLPPTPEVRSS